MTIIFSTRVAEVGPEAANMITGAGMFILFGEEAPDDLAEYCFVINNKNLTGEIIVGGQLVIDGEVYPITAVGSLVQKNLCNLGHITVALDAGIQASLPGTLHVDGQVLPTIKENSLIEIIV